MESPMEPEVEVQQPRPFDRAARRVLGVLIEKAFCTPEYYPMTINAVVTGSNQKSNRAPVMNLSSNDVEDALMSLQEAKLTTRVFPATGRAERSRHNVKDAWQLDRQHRAVLGELLLRGVQSEGELRGRASRMVDIASLDDLRLILTDLAARGFVKRLSPEGQKRGVQWAHLLYEPKETAQVEEQAANAPTPAPASGEPAVAEPPKTAASADLATAVEELRQRLQDLQKAHDQLASEFHALKDELQ